MKQIVHEQTKNQGYKALNANRRTRLPRQPLLRLLCTTIFAFKSCSFGGQANLNTFLLVSEATAA